MLTAVLAAIYSCLRKSNTLGSVLVYLWFQFKAIDEKEVPDEEKSYLTSDWICKGYNPSKKDHRAWIKQILCGLHPPGYEFGAKAPNSN